MADKAAKPDKGKPAEKGKDGKPDGKPKLVKSGETEIAKPKPKPFRIHAHVIDVKGIKPQPGILPDLVVTVTVTGYSTKYTQVVRQTCEANFGAFFEWKTELDFEEFHAAALQFRVLNANTSAKSEALGMYDLKLAQIRKQPNGEYFYTWLALYALPHEHVTELQVRVRVRARVRARARVRGRGRVRVEIRVRVRDDKARIGLGLRLGVGLRTRKHGP